MRPPPETGPLDARPSYGGAPTVPRPGGPSGVPASAPPGSYGSPASGAPRRGDPGLRRLGPVRCALLLVPDLAAPRRSEGSCHRRGTRRALRRVDSTRSEGSLSLGPGPPSVTAQLCSPAGRTPPPLPATSPPASVAARSRRAIARASGATPASVGSSVASAVLERPSVLPSVDARREAAPLQVSRRPLTPKSCTHPHDRRVASG